MRVETVLISDMHLGAKPVNDVLRSRIARERLMPRLAQADQIVLLGDALELRQAPVSEALEAARPFFGELSAAVSGKRVVLVPGNHDHPLLEERVTGQFERVVRATESGPLGQLASWLPQSELLLSYPGYRVRPDVYAIHGHYLDCHNTVPTVETMLVAFAKRRAKFPADGPLEVSDYENTLAPLYTLGFRVAQRARTAAGTPSKKAWAMMARTEGRPGLAARVLGGALVPGGVAALNRLGFGPFHPEISGPALREAGLRALGQVVERLGLEADHVIFGHTHRLGPLDGDEGWATSTGTRLYNTGNWIYEPVFLDRSPAASPYWPGGIVVVDDHGPPRIERVLMDLRHEDFLPMLETSSRVLWPDPRDSDSSPPF
ncbi:MAG TPA: metallophosphoesterase [Thermoleophilaceae bacterium]